MYSVVGDTTSLVPGFPIRTSSDQRSVGSSPRHNAASHVLHRLPVPRHPPCALKHLQHKKPIRKKKLHINRTHKTTNPQRKPAPHACQMLATTIHKSNTTPHHQRWSNNTPTPPTRSHPEPRARACCLKAQQCVWQHQTTPHQRKVPVLVVCLSCTRPPPTTGDTHDR